MSRIMAHRGARNLFAENSLHGFRQILPYGFDAVEFDVHLSDAGEMVVIHDAQLERTTDGHGLVRALTPVSRRALRLKGPDGALIAECPPTLEDVLTLFADTPKIEMWIELKSDECDRPYPGLVEKSVAAIRAAGLAQRAALHSFDISVVEEIRDRAPELKRLVSVNARSAQAQGGLAAVIARVDALVDVLGIHHALYEAELPLIEATLGRERTSVWTINTAELMDRWIDYGPGFLVSDDPVMLQQRLQRETAL